ncbi:MAG TPA: phosphatase PAP2 family protein [Candidatus Paceibacterota bacterium]|nr:phosphatase PAP2 family protein [Candidatus Paceibacterota bacterium]HRZ34417.1 phosphatase PAP2 family protein [Candidatus Paceibacterota bacterium]
MNSLLVTASYYVYFISSWEIIFGFIFAIALWLMAKKRFPALKVFALSTLLTSILTLLIKDVTKISRPADALIGLNDYAFPSGHTAIGFFLLTFLANYIWRSNKSRLFKSTATLILTLAILAIVASRLILRVHTLTQILAGAVLGIGITLWLIKKYDDKL